MTKEEYVSKKVALRAQKLQIEEDIKNLKKEYISSNFDSSLMGKKVKCWMDFHRDDVAPHYYGEGYIAGVDVDYHDNCLIYNINKVKKDGTMSAQPSGYYRVNKIEVIN